MLIRHTIKWVRRASMYCLSTWDKTPDRTLQEQQWFSTKEDAENKLKEINDKDN